MYLKEPSVGIYVLILGLIASALTALAFAVLPAEGQPAPLSPLGIQVVGPNEWLSGSPAALRVVVTNHDEKAPVRRAVVAIRLKPAGDGGSQELFSGRTDARGTLRASFTIPDLPAGQYQLSVSARSRGVTDETTQTITLKRGTQILLTTDKPIYQPSQIIHLRALALRRPTMKADSEQSVTLEVSDAKGNKVFKQSRKTNAFGIVSADFQLADQVNMGSFEIRALLGEVEAQKTVTVKRYVLPKFKLTLTPDKGYYLPGETVEGKLQADYFFGKPVSGGEVEVSVKTFDVEFTEIQKVQGKTDEAGAFKFTCKLPESFVGQPLEQGKAFLQFEAKVTDKAQHSEQTVQISTVAAAPLVVNAVAEGGKFVPGLTNTIYILTTLPTGEPVQATVRLERLDGVMGGYSTGSGDVRTDELGIGELELTLNDPGKPGPGEPTGMPGMGMGMPGMPGIGGMGGGGFAGRMGRVPDVEPPPITLNLAARTKDGTVVRKAVAISTKAGGTDALLLRLDKPLAKVGDTITATALCTSKGGTIYFDVVKDRQTMLTASADVENGKATTDLRFTPDLTGTVYVSAYRINPDGLIVRDVRPMFVQPAGDLKIRIAADKETYLPGGETKLAFSVADPEGKPVAAALGVNVVDESVFALQDLQPGMEKVFFYLEQELMKPRFEIHSFDLPNLIAGGPTPREDAPVAARDRAAKVVFASFEAPQVGSFQVDTYADRLAKARDEWRTQLEPLLLAIRDALQQYGERTGQAPRSKSGITQLIKGGYIKADLLKDPWGKDLRLEPADPDSEQLHAVLVTCAGPDGEFATEDDLVLSTYDMNRWFRNGDDARMARRGGWAEEMAMPMMAPGMAGAGGGMGGGMMDGAVLKMAVEGEAVATAGAPAGKPAVRVREYFPETMFWEPSLITDDNGKATLTLPMADSITTWRLAAVASSAVGQLGSTTQGLRCFQDFFVDIDLPVSLTQNDEVSVPVAVYNYLPGEQTVRLELTKDDWFELKGDDVQSLKIAGNEVDVRYFTFKVRKIGDHPLTVHAYGSQMDDAIKRSIEVLPDGKLAEETLSGRLKGTVEETLTIPEGAIADASNIMVKIYPGIFSQMVEGLDSILQMPSGCFEQTSSATWPNIMVLDYMKTTKQITPEIRMKAEGFINTGYQRMVSYEVPGGGFSWFGQAPANKMLTSYGLMEFHDMSAVHEVDPAVISRTQEWLLQQADDKGVYKPDADYYHAETWGKVQVGELLPTAYVVWALTHTGCRDPRVEKSAAYVRANWKKATEPYSLSIVCNALVGADTVFQGNDLDDSTREATEALIKLAQTKGDQMWWTSGISGITQSTGESADIEATGMACIALIRAGIYSAEVGKVLNYLVAAKDPKGTWYSTNATMLALRALTLSQKNATTNVNGEVTVMVNGEQAGAFALTPDDADVVRFVDCRKLVKPGANKVRIQFAGEGSTLYQMVGSCYLPWKGVEKPADETLAIKVDYDKTTLEKDDTITATVTVSNRTPAGLGMVLVDLGIPPGFTVEDGDFAELVGSKIIGRYNLTGRQAIVYIERMDPRQTIQFGYRLKARFPIKAKTPKSVAYEYYNPDRRSEAKPVDMQVN